MKIYFLILGILIGSLCRIMVDEISFYYNHHQVIKEVPQGD